MLKSDPDTAMRYRPPKPAGIGMDRISPMEEHRTNHRATIDTRNVIAAPTIAPKRAGRRFLSATPRGNRPSFMNALAKIDIHDMLGQIHPNPHRLCKSRAQAEQEKRGAETETQKAHHKPE